MRIRAQARVANETEHDRETRIANMRIRAQDRVDNETEYEREARLADMRIRAQQRHEQQSVELRKIITKYIYTT